MPTPRKLPDDTTLRRLHAEGYTAKLVAQAYDCSASAVSLHWSRLGLEARRTRHSTLLPWRVSQPHLHAIEAHYLRLLSRLGKGEDVKDRRSVSAWNWAKRQEAEGKAIHYLPDQGWVLRPLTGGETTVKLKTVRGQVTVALGSVPE